MNLIKRRSVHPVSLFQQEMNNLFEEFLARPLGQSRPESALNPDWSPSMAVSETENAINVRAEVPGLQRADIDIQIDGDRLEIRGHKNFEKSEIKENFHYSELSFGEFLRRVKLPMPVDPEKARAELKDGVLKIEIPKASATQSRKVSISE